MSDGRTGVAAAKLVEAVEEDMGEIIALYAEIDRKLAKMAGDRRGDLVLVQDLREARIRTAGIARGLGYSVSGHRGRQSPEMRRAS